MKKNLSFFAILAVVTAISCNQNPKSTANTQTVEDHSHHDNCYLAVSGQDTVHLYYHNHDGQVAGTIDFRFKEKQSTNGDIRGEYRGDTLFVDYNYKLNDVASRNPLVFLKREGKLLQGSGEIETYLGKTYFKKGAEINFENGFTFEPVDCN